MKKILLFTLTALTAVVSCDKGNVTPEVRDSFVASVDYVGSKTVMGEIDAVAGTATLYWNGTEAIRVMGANDSSKEYEANVEGNALTATFVAKTSDATLSGDNYLAIYPADPAGGVIWSGNIAEPAAKMWLENDQNLVAGTYDPATHIAVAYTAADNKNLAFKNVTSLIKFTIGNDNAKNPVFYPNSENEYIAGNFNLYYNNGNPSVVVPDDAQARETYVKYTGDVENGKTYYFSVLPTTLATGFTFEVMIDGEKYTKPYEASIELKRNNVLDLGTITFNTDEVKYTTYYFKPSVYLTNNAKIFAYSWKTGNSGVWTAMSDENSDGIYEVNVPETTDNIIFATIPATDEKPTDNWDNVVYKTADLKLENQCYVVGKWMTLDEASKFSYTLLYLNPHSQWMSDGARIAAYFYNSGSDNEWFSMSDLNGDGIYEVAKSEKSYQNVIFVRMNPNTPYNSWSNGWGAQTNDLTVPTDGNNFYTVNSADNTWDGNKPGGSWSIL